MHISDVKETLKKNEKFRQTVAAVKRTGKCTRSIPAFLAERRRSRKEGPIRVGFVCQYIPGWSRVEPVYENMCRDPRFQPFLICLPDRFRDSRLQDPQDMSNPVYDYFVQKGCGNVYNALVGPEEFLDLEKMEPDYVLYVRPYNALMPPSYSSHVVSRYSRVCLIMYGTTLTTGLLDTSFNIDFMRSVYCYFSESEYTRRITARRAGLLHKLGLSRSVNLGSTALEAIATQKDAPGTAWDFSRNPFRVIWTPRWTTDLADGGSNFFTYYRSLLDYARKNPQMDFLYRPHPLAFSHFLETGELTQQELNDYRARCEALPNVQIDTQKEYVGTLWNSSVMIGDISGMVIEYFITGKPIIFCATNMVLTPIDDLQQILEGCYVVNNEEELFRQLDDLSRGVDPLAEKRQRIRRELFGDFEVKPSQRIVEYLAADHNKK